MRTDFGKLREGVGNVKMWKCCQQPIPIPNGAARDHDARWRYVAVAIRLIRLFTQSIAVVTSGKTGNSPRASRYISDQPSLSVILGGQECLLR